MHGLFAREKQLWRSVIPPSRTNAKSTRKRNLPPAFILLPPSPSDGGHVDGLIHSSDFFEQQLFLVEQDHHFFGGVRRGGRGGRGAHHIRTPPSAVALCNTSKTDSAAATAAASPPRCCPRLRGHTRVVGRRVALVRIEHFFHPW